MVESLIIRHAKPNEAEAIASLSVRTFRDAFAADTDPADMEHYLQTAFTLECIQTELNDANTTFLLACGNGSANPIGYAKLKTESQITTHEQYPDEGHSIELERLYVDKSFIGQGIGSALMQACLDESATLGYKRMTLGAWERNTRAIAFYQRWGFEPVGERVFMLGSDQQHDLILQRSVI